MKIYWGLKDVPELASLSRTQRRKVLRACFIEFGFSDWHFWVAFLVFFVFIVLGGLTGNVLHYGLGLPAIVDYACKLVGLIAGWLVYALTYYTVLIDRLRPHFRDYIAGMKFMPNHTPLKPTATCSRGSRWLSFIVNMKIKWKVFLAAYFVGLGLTAISVISMISAGSRLGVVAWSWSFVVCSAVAVPFGVAFIVSYYKE